jgi:NAD(P)-dependent dehydrogenase (short-subunit alcohol dehydrogenase family)
MTLSPFSLNGKTIAVTGASSGIGRATAIMASQLGAKLVLSGRDLERLSQCYSALAGEGHICMPFDLLNESEIQKFSVDCPELDGLVFAAGAAEVVPFRMIHQNHIDKQMQLNFNAPVLFTHAVNKRKKLKPSASLIYISAVADHISPAGSAIYSASKAALNAFVRSIALELAKTKIRANCISPGFVQTAMLDKLSLTTSINELSKLIPLGLIEPEEVASCVVYMLSDASRWVTRSNLVVDGGITSRIRN